MSNDDITYALEYHESTKHSEISLQLSRHYLDWDNKPSVFKIYTKLPSIPLPRDFPQPTLDALTSVSSIMPTIKSVTTLDIRSLSEILFFSDGITRKMNYPYGTYFMRAASATGALYPIELYVVCQDMADSGNGGSGGLAAGVYHFCPGDFSLTKLRAGDYRAELAAATATTLAGEEEDNDSNKQQNIITTSPATIIFTSIAWRNAWKYQSRSYRHWYWDSGVIAANLLATTVSIGMPTALIMGFVDDTVNSLLRLDDKQEAAVAMAVLGIGLSKSSSSIPVLSAEEKDYGGQVPPKAKEEKEERKTIWEVTSSGDIPEVLPISRIEKVINYPEIWKVHRASYLSNIDDVRNWINRFNSSKIIYKKQGFDNNGSSTSTDAEILHSQPLEVKEEESSLSSTTSSQTTLGHAILLRGSSRKFARKPISFQILSNILQSSTRGVPLDFLKGSKESWEQYMKSNNKKGNSIVDIYLIANDISELVKGGAYYFNRESDSLEQLERNASRTMSGYLCLGQQLFSDASAVFFLMTNLQEVLKTLGNRGYRASQFEAGIIAGKIYLSAYAQGIGASGSTFFDDAVTEFFSPHAKEKNAMIVVGVGIPGYTARPGKILAGPLTRIQLINERHNNN